MILGEKIERRDQSPFSFLENINFWKSLPRALSLNIYHWLHTQYIVTYERSYITETYSDNLRSFSRYILPFGT